MHRPRVDARRSGTSADVAGAPRPTTTLRRDGVGLDHDDGDWALVAGARPLAQHPRRSPTATARCSTATASSTTPCRRAAASSSPSTASSTRPTCGSTAPTSATRRGTSSRTRSTSPALSRLGSEHVLAVEVACAPQRDRTAKRNITGVFQHWDCVDPTGTRAGCGARCGSTRPDRCASTGCRVLCRDANDARAHLRLHARLDSDAPRTRRRAHARSTASSRRRRSSRWPAGSTTSPGPSTSTTRGCGGRGRWASSR